MNRSEMFQGRARVKQSKTGQAWFRESDSATAAAKMITTADELTQAQLGVQTRNYRNAVLYGGYSYGMGSRFGSSVAPIGPLSSIASHGGRIGPSYNIINSVVNTVLSRMLTNGAPHVTFLTNKGSWVEQQKAKLLEQFTEGLFYQTGFDKVANRCLLDALVFGTGFVKISTTGDGNIRADRVFPNEIWVEAWDGREQNPRTMYQIGTVDRYVLASQYKKHKEVILAAKAQSPVDKTNVASLATEQVPYWEAWRLPSPGKDDGRHILCLNKNTVLVDEKWTGDFPFAAIRYQDNIVGYLGTGIAELLWGHQSALNDVTRAEYVAHSQMSMPRIYVDRDARLDENKLLSSKSGLILKGSGPNPPVPLTWPAVNPDFVQWKQWIIQSAYEFVGVSLMAATGTKPQGLNSGAAIRDYMDTSDSRFTVLSQSFGQFYIDATKVLIATAKELYESEGTFKITTQDKKFLQTIDWKDIDLADEDYTLKLYETSSLPRTPAGRLNTVQDLLQANLISPDVGRKLLNFPDVDSSMQLENAAEENAEKTAYELLNSDDVIVPDPVQNLQLCIATVTKEMLVAINNSAPDDKVERCKIWLQQAQDMLSPPIQPNIQGAPTPNPPQAVPTPSPVSPLLSNLPQ